MKANGEKMTNCLVRGEILRNQTLYFKYVVAAIKKSKYLSEMSINELQGSLADYEHHLNLKSLQ